MSVDRRMNKDMVHIFNGILLSHLKEWNNAICSNMDGPGDYHTNWGKSERERQIISYDIAYMRNLKKKWYKWTYLQNRNRLTDLENKHGWASLVAQWLRIRLPMQGTQVQALVWEDPTCLGATKPVLHNYWACTLEPASHNYWNPCT